MTKINKNKHQSLIDNLIQVLEGERIELAESFMRDDLEKNPEGYFVSELMNADAISDSYEAGHEVGSGRVLALLEQSLLVLEFYAKESNWLNATEFHPKGKLDIDIINQGTENEKTIGGKAARDFIRLIEGI